MLVEYWYDKHSFQARLIEHTHFESIESTHVYARNKADHLESIRHDVWQLVTADCQTAGIGQRDRQWSSPEFVNIYATYTIPFPVSEMPLLFNISQVTTIAVARVLETLVALPQIKWVNDLLIDGKKVCGVLCENRGTIISDPDTCLLVISIGLNVNMSEADCQNLGQPVTSLSLETDKSYDRTQVLEILNESLFTTFQTFILHGLAPLLPYLKDHMVHMGKKVILEENGIEVEGIFESVTDQGTMLLNIDGKIQERVTGRIIRTF